MNCLQPIEVWPDEKKHIVPCGKCLACLSNKRNDWSFRLMQEYKRSRSAAFITLTYHPKYVPDDGVSKRHLQLFMKRLRKRCGDKLRYYAVGEYGSKTNRPHYHIILFNYENEESIRKAWSTRTGEPFGLVHVGKVTEASIMYTTKYVIQRNSHSSKLARPFALMSRGYGLGLWYLTDAMVAWHRTSSVRTARNYTLRYGEKGRLPRYYKEKIWPNKHDRERVSMESAYQARKVHRNNLKLLKEMGYSPHKILAEMRDALVSRIKEKVAFTQSI